MKAMTAAILVATLSASAAARAEEGEEKPSKHFFFSRPDLPAEQVAADWEECRELVGPMQPPAANAVYYAPQGGAAGLAGAAAAGFIQGIIRARQRSHMIDAGIRKCMHIKGYVRYEMSKEEAKQIYSGGWSEIRPRLVFKALAPVGDAERLEP